MAKNEKRTVRRALDPLLRRASRRWSDAMHRADLEQHLGVFRDAGTVSVALHARGDGIRGRLEALGCSIDSAVSRLGAAPAEDAPQSDLLIASVPVERLVEVAALDDVDELEAARPLHADAEVVRLITGIDAVQEAAEPESLGADVVVGIIDSGVDYRHPAFLAAPGRTRIAHLWDQRSGHKYDRADIEHALATGVSLQHTDVSGHGTHVTAIAAGAEHEAHPLRGVARAADLIVVALPTTGGFDGFTTQVMTAAQHIVDTAAGRPVVINVSLGMNGGGHVGETVLETVLDNLSRTPGVVFVKSAGNERNTRSHAGWRTLGRPLAAGETAEIRLRVVPGTRATQSLEIWHDDADVLAVRVHSPDGERSPLLDESSDHDLDDDDDPPDFTSASGNVVEMTFTSDVSDTGDTRCTVTIERGSAARIDPGIWVIEVHARHVEHGHFDAWVERLRGEVRFGEQAVIEDLVLDERTYHALDTATTINVPGTGRRVVSVGSHRNLDVARRANVSRFSGEGPTRWGLPKPDLCAPGEYVISALSGASARPPRRDDPAYTRGKGTSMAAPVVTGIVAMLLARRPDLTAEQVQQVLARGALTDRTTGETPSHRWGVGKASATLALATLDAAAFPVISDFVVSGLSVRWRTDVPATGVVILDRRHRRVLGRHPRCARLESPALDTEHRVDFSGLESGAWYLEIVAAGADGYWSSDDGHPGRYRIIVP